MGAIRERFRYDKDSDTYRCNDCSAFFAGVDSSKLAIHAKEHGCEGMYIVAGIREVPPQITTKQRPTQ